MIIYVIIKKGLYFLFLAQYLKQLLSIFLIKSEKNAFSLLIKSNGVPYSIKLPSDKTVILS